MKYSACQGNNAVQAANLLQDSNVYLSDLSTKDKSWDENKTRAVIATEHTKDTDLNKHSVRMATCADILWFDLVQHLEGNQQLDLKSVWLCKVRECPMCSNLRARVWQKRCLGGIPPMIEANPKLRFLFLTLTVKNCDVTDLRKTLDSMNNGFKKLMKRTKVDKVVKGYLRRFEVTKNSDGTAHPHFHVILAVMPSYFSQNYINQAEWTDLWKESLQIDYTPVVNIKAVKATAKCADPHLSIVNEVTKTACYCSKDKDLLSDKEWFLEHTRQVARTKEIVFSGIFRDYITDKPIEEEDILNASNEEEENEPIVIKADIPFRYEIKTQKYVGNL